MRLILHILRSVNDVLEKVVMLVATLLMAMIVLLVFGGAATRYLTGIGYAFMHELPPMLLPWIVFTLAGVLMRSDGHIAVDMLPSMLSRRNARILRGVVSLIAIAAAIVFCIGGIEAVELFMLTGQRTEMEYAFPIWWIYLSFPVGFVILISFALENLLDAIVGGGSSEHPHAATPPQASR